MDRRHLWTLPSGSKSRSPPVIQALSPHQISNHYLKPLKSSGSDTIKRRVRFGVKWKIYGGSKNCLNNFLNFLRFSSTFFSIFHYFKIIFFDFFRKFPQLPANALPRSLTFFCLTNSVKKSEKKLHEKKFQNQKNYLPANLAIFFTHFFSTNIFLIFNLFFIIRRENKIDLFGQRLDNKWMNSLGLNFVDDHWAVFFFLLVASAAEDSERVLDEWISMRSSFCVFFFYEIWELREIPGLRKNWTNYIRAEKRQNFFNDFLECNPQSSFCLACPGSHVFWLENIPKNCSDLTSWIQPCSLRPTSSFTERIKNIF